MHVRTCTPRFPDLANGWTDRVHCLCVNMDPLDKSFTHVWGKALKNSHVWAWEFYIVFAILVLDALAFVCINDIYSQNWESASWYFVQLLPWLHHLCTKSQNSNFNVYYRRPLYRVQRPMVQMWYRYGVQRSMVLSRALYTGCSKVFLVY